MRINFYCIINHTGAGRFAENFCTSIAANARQGTILTHIIPNDENAIETMVAQGREDDVTFFFPIDIPNFVHRVKGKKIYWFVFETNRIASSILKRLDAYDEIWVPSQWAYHVLVSQGLPRAKIRVLSEGVNSKLYHPSPLTHKDFVFLSIGKYEKRKSIDEIIDAFSAEFPAIHYPHIQLRLKADFPLFPQRIEDLKQRTSSDPRINVLDGLYAEEQLIALYREADAFLFPSRAEGFGLPGIEALACGIPLLTTNYSGQTEYLKMIEGLYKSIDYKMVDIMDPDFDYFYQAIYKGEPYGQWAEPVIPSLRAGMRDLYANNAAWRERARLASGVIRTYFDWQVVANRALDMIGQ